MNLNKYFSYFVLKLIVINNFPLLTNKTTD